MSAVNPRLLAAGLTAGVIAMATPVVMHFEGKRNDPYRDVVDVATVCYGETKNVENRRYSDAECAALLAKSLERHWEGVSKCIKVELPQHTKAALASFTYNVGVGAACGSTLMKKINAGDLVGGCHELDKWVYADGKILAGLVKRRAAERLLFETKDRKSTRLNSSH